MLKRRENVNSKANEVVKEIESKLPEKVRVEFLHSGLTTLNLALSGRGFTGGWARGRILNIVGDGSSGKTILALELAAQCFFYLQLKSSELYSPIKKLLIVYNNVEFVMDFPLEEMYGKDFVDSVEWIQTPTIEEFGRDYANRVMNLKPGEFLLYIVDSFDALTSEAGLERFEKAARTDKAEDGSFGTEKAKYGSASFFNNICSMMEGKDTTLFIISQVRDNIGVTFGKKYRRNGGKALDFYTHQVCWLAEVEKLKHTFKKDKRAYGIRVRAKIERNKTAKPFREVEFIILFDYGVDDIGSSLAWLYGPDVKKLTWHKKEYSRDELIAHIEKNNLEKELAQMVEAEWLDIEENIKPERKSKFYSENS